MAPPEFTEAATIDAMHSLQILPEDLVPQEPPEDEDLELRLELTIELDRRRYERISQIVMERNRILEEAITPPTPQKRSRERSPEEDEEMIDFESRYLPSPVPFREAIQQRAQIRLEKVRRDAILLHQRQEQWRQAKEMERQREARLYMRLQERKQQALEEERKWRHDNVYRGASFKRRPQVVKGVTDSRPEPLISARRSGGHVTRPVVQEGKHPLAVVPTLGGRRL
jgi:hypothetical protein